jgi:hypothetical protein
MNTSRGSFYLNHKSISLTSRVSVTLASAGFYPTFLATCVVTSLASSQFPYGKIKSLAIALDLSEDARFLLTFFITCLLDSISDLCRLCGPFREL